MENTLGTLIAIAALLAFGYFIYTRVTKPRPPSSGTGTGGRPSDGAERPSENEN